jgi:predicted RNA-binding Zn-ribbon protein involved in translation (DUF1610 family)
MADPRLIKGPWTHRALIVAFSVALGTLIYWLLSFIVDDIAKWPGPDYQQLETQLLEPALLRQEQELAEQIEEANRQISQRQERQGLLRDSTQSSEQTMNQLLEIHRLSLEKNIEPTAAEQQALAEAEQLFLSNQKQYQQLNAEIVQSSERLTDLQRQQRVLGESLAEARNPISAEYQRLQRWHELKVTTLQLAVLLLLAPIALSLFLKWRHSYYAPLIYAFGIALAAKATVVMHRAFPAKYFKYILILAALAIVARILVLLLHSVARPGKDYLLKQYREAYERFVCPLCGYPIRRGPLKYLFWSRHSIKKLHVPPTAQPLPDEAYTCPACGTQLFESCPSCGKVRHSLLPACADCGDQRSFDILVDEVARLRRP